MADLVAIARIGKPRGVRGQVWLDLYRPDLEGLLAEEGRAVSLDAPGAAGPYRVATFFCYAKGAVLGLEGVTTFEAAQALLGAQVLLPPEAVPPDPPGTFDVEEVLGWQVVDARRGPLGTVRGVQEAGEYWVLDVEAPGGTVEIPAVEGLGVEVDREGRAFHVDLPPGWPGVDPDGGAR